MLADFELFLPNSKSDGQLEMPASDAHSIFTHSLMQSMRLHSVPSMTISTRHTIINSVSALATRRITCCWEGGLLLQWW